MPKLKPSFNDASNPDPIAKPSGKICIAKPVDTIIPVANDKIKLKNLFEFFFITIPKIPPIVVPNVPKNNPNNVIFKFLAYKKLLKIFLFLVYFKKF